MTPGRVVPPGRLHRHEPVLAMQAGCSVLQSKRYGRTVDSRGKECGEMDKALMPRLHGQPCAIAIVRPGVQPGQLSTPTGSATSHEDLDDDDLAGEADQDRGQSGSACQVRNLPDGGGCGAVSAIPSDPGTDTTTRRAVAEGIADMTVANRLPAEPTTRGRRCQSVPTPAEAIQWTSKPPFFAPTRPFDPVAGRKSACGASNSTGGGILVLEWPGGGVGRRSSGKCRPE